MRALLFVTAFAAFLSALSPGAAEAGRGGSAQAIKSAITSNSVDAIAAELERAEYLVCAACTDLVAALVDHADYRVRKVAAWWLARRGASRQVHTTMLQRLSQPDSVKARNAADVLGELGYPSSIPALSAAVANPIFDGDARAAMARALGSIGRPAAEAGLVGALGAPEPAVKIAALASLREVEGFRNAGLAAALLGDGDERVRAEAAITFGALRATTGAATLVSLLTSDPSPQVRKKAAWALGEMRAPATTAAEALQRAATSDSDALVRSIAAAAISKLSR
jgi:HEAT repeat protein